MIKGIDISRHQGRVDWGKIEAAVKSKQISFVIMRAGYGGGGIDDQFARNWAEARRRNIPRQAYFFAYPGRGFGVAQAKEFYGIVGKLQPGESVSLDMEDEPTYGRRLVPGDVQWALDFLNKARDLFGVKPLIYMNSDLKQRYNWNRVQDRGFGLWLANYGPNNGRPGQEPNPAPWKFWAIWQFTSRGNVGGISPVDVNLFNGSVKQFKEYGKQGGGSSPAPSKPKPSKPKAKPSGKIYVVKAGDSLSKIAAKYGTSWQKIYNDNRSVIGSNPNFIKPGQRLRIGGSDGPSGNKYTVKRGDSLSSIAAKHNTTWQRIYNRNKAVIGSDPNLIKPGQVLTID